MSDYEMNMSPEEIEDIKRWIEEVGPEVAMMRFAKHINELAEKMLEVTNNRTLRQIDEFLEERNE